MAANELVALWKQIEILHGAVATLIEVQKECLESRHANPDRSDRADEVSPAYETLIRRLEELESSLGSFASEAEGRAQNAEPRARFGEVDVERLNITEPGGAPRIVLSSAAKAPPPLYEGEPVGERSGGNPAGLYFYNEEGSECGGLSFRGKSENGRYSAGALLAFDQYRQDQVIGLEHSEQDGERFTGLKVWDRPEMTIPEVWQRLHALDRMPAGPAKDQAREELYRAAMIYEHYPMRIFVGKDNQRSAIIGLRDPENRERIKMYVDATGTPRLEFKDEHGNITCSLPDTGEG